MDSMAQAKRQAYLGDELMQERETAWECFWTRSRMHENLTTFLRNVPKYNS